LAQLNVAGNMVIRVNHRYTVIPQTIWLLHFHHAAVAHCHDIDIENFDTFVVYHSHYDVLSYKISIAKYRNLYML